MDLPEFVALIEEKLENQYHAPDLGNYDSPVDEIVYLMLCTKTSSNKVKKAFRRVRKAIQKWDSSSLDDAKLVEILKPLGNSQRRASQVIEAINHLNQICSCDLEFLRTKSDKEIYSFLTAIPHVGQKIAHCVMAFCFNRNYLPVDTHIARILRRLSVVERNLSMDDIGDAIQEYVPNGKHIPLHVNLIAHGRSVCKAISPKCDKCIVAEYCAYAGYHILMQP